MSGIRPSIETEIMAGHKHFQEQRYLRLSTTDVGVIVP